MLGYIKAADLKHLNTPKFEKLNEFTLTLDCNKIE